MGRVILMNHLPMEDVSQELLQLHFYISASAPPKPEADSESSAFFPSLLSKNRALPSHSNTAYLRGTK